MPFVRINDIRMHYRTDGNPAHPSLVLSNSLGTDLSMWDAQAAALSRDFYVVRYDTRGHGQSQGGSVQVDLDLLGADVVGLLDTLAIPRAHFCGISMGGMIGQWLAINQPQRIGKLVLANTAARIGTADGWTVRADEVRQRGMDGVADGAAARWFTPEFIERERHVVDRMIGRLREQDRDAYAACCDALAKADLRSAIASISAPTLLIAGDRDPVTTVVDGEWMCQQVANARLLTVPASHISNVEAQPQFTRALAEFLATGT
jgi:3-oxoadipate enol-lactonase